ALLAGQSMRLRPHLHGDDRGAGRDRGRRADAGPAPRRPRRRLLRDLRGTGLHLSDALSLFLEMGGLRKETRHATPPGTRSNVFWHRGDTADRDSRINEGAT